MGRDVGRDVGSGVGSGWSYGSGWGCGSALENQRVEKSISPKAKVRILAILGNSTGIDIQKDRVMLEQLPDAEVIFRVEPQRKELNDQLWSQPWDILFFAGHSSSQADGNTGQIYINQTDSLSIAELKNALKKAIALLFAFE